MEWIRAVLSETKARLGAYFSFKAEVRSKDVLSINPIPRAVRG
jgi:hypothetical protein